MKTRASAASLAIACLVAAGPEAQADRALKISFIDVEGGQATLVTAPSGESMLVDTGYPGFNGRDADRIAAEARHAGVSRIDYLVVTHYHNDHVGGVPALADRMPIDTFVDHGPSVEKGGEPDALVNAYEAVRRKGRHLQVRAGDRLPTKDFQVWIVSSAGELLREPLRAAGRDNPLCGSYVAKEDDPTENARSVGMLVGFGRFRMLNLGDLTWNKEHGLACPKNLVGDVDVYLTTHHGLPTSGAPVLVHAVAPRVAIMNNGSRKGGSPEAWRTVRTSPRLEDFWQLHYAQDAGADHNVPEAFIANIDESTAHPLRLTAFEDGRFVVTNTRNGHTRRYKP